jgi:hypothetical protein
MVGNQAAATVAIIKGAIQARVCLSGTHLGFRVRFAPYALGRDAHGRQIVIASEYSGRTLDDLHWVHFAVDHLGGLVRTEDQWRSGPMENMPQFNLTEIGTA